MRGIGTVLTLALGLGLAASAARASHQEAILGAGGELYRIQAGTYRELFPDAKDIDPANPVLALETVKPDGTVQRSLVPGTEGSDVDREPFLRYEETSHTVFLVWESRVNVVHPVLMLSGFDGEWLWQDPIEVVGNPFAMKTSPQLAVTHDTYQDGGATRHRTILHVVWGEEAGNGPIETFYTPIILEGGVFAGRSPVYKLNEWDRAEPASGPVASGLLSTIRIQGGHDERTVVAAFTSPRSGRLVTLEIDSLPPQLVRLADDARSHIVDIGARLYPSQLEGMAEEARSHIVDIGAAFHPEVVRSIAEQVKTYILTEGRRKEGKEALKAIADGARSHIVDIGAKLSSRGLRGVNSASTAAEIVEVVPSSHFAPPEDTPKASPHLLHFRQVSGRPAPEVGESELTLFLSESGQDVLVAWVDGDRVLYRESQGAGWRPLLEIKLSKSLDLRQAFEILENRVRHR